jgi:geranylgeranyl diphosphate synthase type II
MFGDSKAEQRIFFVDFNTYLIKKQNTVDTFLREYLVSKKKNGSCPKYLQKAMAYSLLAGGKRLRAILVMASYGVSGRKSRGIVPVASAIELIHTYSLIHDDLPAMDDDDFRRNKPTNHRVFGIIKELSYASGPEGMVGGQTADILYEDKKINKKQLHYIHTHKTGALIRASVRIGALMAETSRSIFLSLTKYGENIGLAYQIIDDILDVVGSQKELGKSTGADASRGKNTYPSLFGLEASQKKAESLIHDSLGALKRLDHKADPLREIANYILRRRN